MIQVTIPKKLIVLCCLLFTLSVNYATSVTFFKGTFTELAAQAKAENKPFFVCVYKDDCLSSQKMNDTTFLDSEVARYVTQNYLAYRVEYTSFDGFEICEKMNITHYPNVTFFTSDARPIYEVEGYQNPATFIGNLTTELQNMRTPNFCPGHAPHYKPKHVYNIPQPKIEYPEGFRFDIPVANKQEGLDFDSPKVLFRKGLSEDENPSISHRYDAPNSAVWKKMSNPLLPNVRPSFDSEEMLASADNGEDFSSSMRGMNNNKPKERVIREKPIAKARDVVSAPQENEDEYALSNYPNARYGVQVGAFRDIEVAKTHLNKYKDAGEANIILTPAIVNEQEVYKLVLGAFETRQEAEQKLYDLKNDAGVEGFILDFNKVR